MKTTTFLFAITSVLFGWLFIIKSAIWLWKFELWLGAFVFDMSNWRSEDKIVFGALGILLSSIIALAWLAYYFPGKKEVN